MKKTVLWLCAVGSLLCAATGGASAFDLGDTIKMIANTNVRTGAGTGYAEIVDPDYSGTAPVGMIGRITAGPRSANGYTWWMIDFGPGLYSGWAVQDGLQVATPAKPTAADVTLTLYVHDRSATGPAIPGVNVTGQDGAGSSFNQTSNSGGAVVITGKPGNWKLTASKTSYQPTSWAQDISSTCTRHAFLLPIQQSQPITSPPTSQKPSSATATSTTRSGVPTPWMNGQQIENAIQWAQKKLGQTYKEGQGLSSGGYCYSCLGFVEDAYNRTGTGVKTGYVSAANAAIRLNSQQNSGTTPPPRGAWVFYRWSTDGHVALSLGDGRVINALTNISQKQTQILISPYDQISGTNYIGWAWPEKSDNAPTQPVSQATAPTPIVSAKPGAPAMTSPGLSSEPGQLLDTLTPTLQWKAVAGADYYALAISESPYGASHVVHNPQRINGTSYAMPSGVLKPGKKYRWNTQAHSPAGLSDISATLYFQTKAQPATTQAQAVPVSDNSQVAP